MALIGVLYSGLYVISNLTCFSVFACKKQKKIANMKGFKPSPARVRKNFAQKYVKNPPKAFYIMNAIITALLALDIASYPLVKKLLDKADW